MSRRATPKPRPVDLHVGARIRQFWLDFGISPAELASRIGEPRAAIDRFERGMSSIGASQLHEIASVLGIPIGDFFDGLPGGPLEDGALPPDQAVVMEAQRFLRIFNRVENQKLRKGIYDLVTSVSRGEADPGGDDPE